MASSIVPKINKAFIGTPDTPKVWTGSYKWLDDNKGDASGMSFQYIRVERIQQRGINLETGKTNGISVKDAVFEGMGNVSNSIYPMGILLKRGSNASLERVTVSGISTAPDGDSYRQGDGICCEMSFSDISLKDVVVKDCTDGGIDSKAKNLTLDNVTLSNNKINLRIWYYLTQGITLTSTNPTKYHVQLNTRESGAASLKLSKFIVKSTTKAPIFVLDNGCSIDITDMEIDVPEGTKLIAYHEGGSKANTIVKLPSYVKVDSNGFVVNTSKIKTITLAEPLNDGNGDGIIELSDKTADKLKLPRGTRLRVISALEYEILN